jgi:transcriptional regulator with XRE-family HTH domain
MNVEIAQRLAELRREKGFSQEELASKLGLSRQAVSKWERAESSPDTDNLIALATLYGVSLDELLKLDIDQQDDTAFAAADRTKEKDDAPTDSDGANADTGDSGKDYVYVGPRGIHVKDETDEVHVGWDGIHVNSSTDGEVHVDKNGVVVDGEQYTFKDAHRKWNHRHHKKNWMQRFPYPILCIIAFLCLGLFANLWHPGWVIFLTIPLWYGIASAINPKESC